MEKLKDYDAITKELEDVRGELNLLKKQYDILVRTSQYLDFDSVFSIITGHLKNNYGFEGFILSLINADQENFSTIKFDVPSEFNENTLNYLGKDISIHKTSSSISKSIVSYKPVLFYVTDDFRSECKFDQALIENFEIKTCLHIPISFQTEIMGVITLMSHISHIYADESDINEMYMFLNQIAYIIKNSRLYDNMAQGRAFLLSLVENSPIGIQVVNKKGQIIFVNPAIENIGIFNPRDVPIINWIDNESIKEAKLDMDFKKVLSGRTVYRENVSMRSIISDKIKFLNLTLTPIYNELNNVENVLMIFYDNTEKAIAEKTLLKDLQTAKKIQNSVMSQDINKMPELDIGVYFHPMMEVGGDIYDVFSLNKETCRIFIADATGHGVQGSLTTMLIKAEYDKLKTLELEPNILLKLFNKTFYESYPNLNVFFTCLLIDIDIKNNKLLFASAGSPPQILIKNGQLHKINCQGTVIGVIKENDYQNLELDFNKGDKLLLYTDGMFEEFSESKEMYSEIKLYSIVNTNKHKDIHSLIKSIVHDLDLFRGKAPFHDDKTLIGIQKR